jgi:hypothetical protein
MIPDELEALVVADSVGALDPDERVDLQARLAVLTPDERSEVARLYDAATAMAASVPPLEPPAHVRERLLAETRKPSRYTVWAADAAWIDTGLPGIRARVLAVDKVRSLVTLAACCAPGISITLTRIPITARSPRPKAPRSSSSAPSRTTCRGPRPSITNLAEERLRAQVPGRRKRYSLHCRLNPAWPTSWANSSSSSFLPFSNSATTPTA